MRTRLPQLAGRFRTVDPMLVDAGVAAVLLTISLVDIWAASSPRDPVTATATAVLLAVAVAVRRRWLLLALGGVLTGYAVRIGILGLHGGNGPSGIEGSLMALLVFYGAGAYLEGALSVMALAVGLVLTSLSAVGVPGPFVANLVWDDAVVALMPWFVGRMVSERQDRARRARERAEQLDAEHEGHTRVAALAERARLAREIHDVVAHSVSVMVIQAGGARSVMDGEPLRAQEALLSVERAGREALAEMRRLLGVLGDGERMRELAPQPGIDDLGELIARTRAAGLPASMSVVGQPVDVPPGLSLCAYRVVQEALTNTLRHAGVARAEVLVRWGEDVLELEVADDGPGLPTEAVGMGGGGHGIIGMRERAALHGGQVESGPAPGGGFSVRALIPLAGLASP